MLNNKEILRVMTILMMAISLATAHPPQELRQRLTQSDTEPTTASQALDRLYRYEQTLSRLRRALEDLVYEDEANDDMDLAEINVFRPLFRYRAEVAKQVKNPPRQLG